MEKTKINYYLFVIFVILLLLNIFFYFFGGSLLGWLFYARENILAQSNPNNPCPGSESCVNFVDACLGVGGGGGHLQINEFKVQTFLCGDPDWNAEPWNSAMQDGTPSSTAPKPSTTSPPSQTCNVTNVNEPIYAILNASSTQQATLKITFKDKNGNIVKENSTTINNNVGILTSTYTPTMSTIPTTTVEASICRDSNCITTSTTVKVYQYQCGFRGGNTGFCYFVLSTTTGVRLENDSWCKFWINKQCTTKID